EGPDNVALSIKKALISLPKGLTEIKTGEVAALIEKGPKTGSYFLVDARPARVASAEHIPTAVSIPVNVLKKKGEKLLPTDKNTMLIFYCGGPT
ncbi:MAG: rhodanese-like domain-containing protein, partial [Deltaproteobacteria bacterium]|nr:rhodanese-like domain-containing protein [Deltaproteobacteria bacterium]